MEINVTIVGTTPLLCNRFSDEAAENATSGNRPSIASASDAPREVAHSKLYLDVDGRPMIPGPNIYRSIIDAGVFFKVGKRQITTQKSSLLPSCVLMTDAIVHIKHMQDWCVDTRPIRNPATGGRMLRHRPLFWDWELSFTLALDKKEMAPKLLREIVDKAGTAVGLGDFRPACKGMFGRFRVDSWAEQRNGQAPAGNGNGAEDEQEDDDAPTAGQPRRRGRPPKQR